MESLNDLFLTSLTAGGLNFDSMTELMNLQIENHVASFEQLDRAFYSSFFDENYDFRPAIAPHPGLSAQVKALLPQPRSTLNFQNLHRIANPPISQHGYRQQVKSQRRRRQLILEQLSNKVALAEVDAGAVPFEVAPHGVALPSKPPLRGNLISTSSKSFQYSIRNAYAQVEGGQQQVAQQSQREENADILIGDAEVAAAAKIQLCAVAFLERKDYLAVKSATAIIQRCFRGFKATKSVEKLKQQRSEALQNQQPDDSCFAVNKELAGVFGQLRQNEADYGEFYKKYFNQQPYKFGYVFPVNFVEDNQFLFSKKFVEEQLRNFLVEKNKLSKNEQLTDLISLDLNLETFRQANKPLQWFKQIIVFSDKVGASDLIYAKNIYVSHVIVVCSEVSDLNYIAAVLDLSDEQKSKITQIPIRLEVEIEKQVKMNMINTQNGKQIDRNFNQLPAFIDSNILQRFMYDLRAQKDLKVALVRNFKQQPLEKSLHICDQLFHSQTIEQQQTFSQLLQKFNIQLFGVQYNKQLQVFDYIEQIISRCEFYKIEDVTELDSYTTEQEKKLISMRGILADYSQFYSQPIGTYVIQPEEQARVLGQVSQGKHSPISRKVFSGVQSQPTGTDELDIRINTADTIPKPSQKLELIPIYPILDCDLLCRDMNVRIQNQLLKNMEKYRLYVINMEKLSYLVEQQVVNKKIVTKYLPGKQQTRMLEVNNIEQFQPTEASNYVDDVFEVQRTETQLFKATTGSIVVLCEEGVLTIIASFIDISEWSEDIITRCHGVQYPAPADMYEQMKAASNQLLNYFVQQKFSGIVTVHLICGEVARIFDVKFGTHKPLQLFQTVQKIGKLVWNSKHGCFYLKPNQHQNLKQSHVVCSTVFAFHKDLKRLSKQSLKAEILGRFAFDTVEKTGVLQEFGQERIVTTFVSKLTSLDIKSNANSTEFYFKLQRQQLKKFYSAILHLIQLQIPDSATNLTALAQNDYERTREASLASNMQDLVVLLGK